MEERGRHDLGINLLRLNQSSFRNLFNRSNFGNIFYCFKDKGEKTVTSEEFKKELTDLINIHSLEGQSDTPDFILGSYLMSCLETWNIGIEDLIPCDEPCFNCVAAHVKEDGLYYPGKKEDKYCQCDLDERNPSVWAGTNRCTGCNLPIT